MTPKEPRNINYAATLVSLKDFVQLDNCANVKAALIYSNSVIVSNDAKVNDLGLFFPVETQLSEEFLSKNNLYRKAEYGNSDPKAKGGFFERSGRIKALKFRGHKSEGFWVPISYLEYITDEKLIRSVQQLPVGTSFDFVGNHEICRKYTLRQVQRNLQIKQVTARIEDSIIDNQFRLHYDTANLRRNLHKIKPTDFISITDKWHGTSAVFSKVLVKRKLSIIDKIAKFFKANIQEDTYGLVYSSRRVIKAVNGVEKNNKHFYSEDIWGIVAKEIEDKIPNGFSIYGEIVGFTPNKQAIQKDYTYSQMPGYHSFNVYRVTLTNNEGKTIELNWLQVQEFCSKYGFDIVPTIYVGFAANLFPNLDLENHWQEEFLKKLENRFVADQDCIYNPGLPAEGIVLRIDRLNESEAFKLKNFRFLESESKQLDAGIIDMESIQSDVEL